MNDTTLDLRSIIAIIKKRRCLIAQVFGACIGVALLACVLLPPTYEAEATLRIKQSRGLANSLLGDMAAMNPLGTKQQMSTYAEILTSRTVIQQVIHETQQAKEELPVYEDFVKRIVTQPVKDTEILIVKVQAKSPEEAELVANTLVDAFVQRLTVLVRQEQSKVREFIGKRLYDSQLELEKAENALQQYKSEQKIIAPSEEIRALIDKLSQADKLAADNQVALEAARAKLTSTDGQLAHEKPGFFADNAVIEQYRLKLASLEVELVSLGQNFTANHPKVMSVQAAADETRRKLGEEITKVINADAASANPVHQGLIQAKLQTEADLAVGEARQQALQVIIAQGAAQVDKLPAKEQGFIKVSRDVTLAQEIYIMLAKRYEEARISEVMEPTDVQVIDHAAIPVKPVKPKKILYLAVAAVLGVLFGFGSAFVLEFLHQTVRSADDVQHYLELPVLGSIPAFDAKVPDAGGKRWPNISLSFMKTRNR